MGGKGGQEKKELKSVVGAYTMRAGRLFFLFCTYSIYTSMPITSTSLPVSKNSQNFHLLPVPWDCKIKSCLNLLSPEAILSELWAAIRVFGIPQYTKFYPRAVELEHFQVWSFLCTTSHCFILFLPPLFRGY